jgi:hypothetical protein
VEPGRKGHGGDALRPGPKRIEQPCEPSPPLVQAEPERGVSLGDRRQGAVSRHLDEQVQILFRAEKHTVGSIEAPPPFGETLQFLQALRMVRSRVEALVKHIPGEGTPPEEQEQHHHEAEQGEPGRGFRDKSARFRSNGGGTFHLERTLSFTFVVIAAAVFALPLPCVVIFSGKDFLFRAALFVGEETDTRGDEEKKGEKHRVEEVEEDPPASRECSL